MMMNVYDPILEPLDQKVHLRPVDQTNWYDCAGLKVTEEQQNVFPVPAVYWLAESAYCGFTPLALYHSEQLVGLAVYAVDPEDGSYWIMAYLIDHRHQHKGYGFSGIKTLIRHIREKHGCDTIVLGHRIENRQAAKLYDAVGFVEVSRDEHEVRRELRLAMK
ncbi:GNAT family N-acetyltransferase [Paenibacillus sp. 1011MAR3C5]|uniref:GNAT family N-acetyltransferase n=1 Tax=Paenibacillus sp. 1011MAR3C5 TaxID=1675787 RepID=UPI000E6CFF03|nr:GNAT family N-acetyltransferase [Paenibacillus sp. 1011MAR3C5]RJE88384.1 GNAT family N-acetyltransferase [Paenibacillus sp. 1011MAR3C5]